MKTEYDAVCVVDGAKTLMLIGVYRAASSFYTAILAWTLDTMSDHESFEVTRCIHHLNFKAHTWVSQDVNAHYMEPSSHVRTSGTLSDTHVAHSRSNGGENDDWKALLWFRDPVLCSIRDSLSVTTGDGYFISENKSTTQRGSPYVAIPAEGLLECRSDP